MEGIVHFFDSDFVAVETQPGVFTIIELFSEAELQIGVRLKWPDGVRGRLKIEIGSASSNFEGAIQYIGATRAEIEMLLNTK
ncbi:MAG: hypothetical protein U0930_18635 [Pirellulales bacterium]